MRLVDVLQARERISGTAVETPLLPSHLPGVTGCELLLKLETVQPTGSFKLRGAANAMALLTVEERRRGVACCSTGNHGRAVAYAAQRAGVAATICLSEIVPRNKIDAIKALGASVCRGGKSQDEAQVNVDRLVAQEGMIEIPPFDHEAVVAGQGTIALEILEQRPDIATIVVPLSGGGLSGGIAFTAKAINPDIRIIAVSQERGAAMHESLRAGRPLAVAEVPTLADSLGGGIGLSNRVTFDLCRRFVDETVVVSESEIYRGMRSLFLYDRIVTEGGAAVGAAAVLARKFELQGPAAIIISGNNVDLDQFLRIARGEPVPVGETVVHA